MSETCPECGAVWHAGITCQDHFHQMLFWEHEDPALGVVHHLLVLCYHIQHPSLYSPDGLKYAHGLLISFVERGVSPQAQRAQMRSQVDSGKRQFKITAREGLRGSYAHPIQWTMTAADVAADGKDQYIASVEAWARAVLDALRVSGNLLA